VRFLAEEGDVMLRAELAKRFREATAPQAQRRARAAGQRTVAQLLAARDVLAEEKSLTKAEKTARERARREREQAEAKAQYLDELAGREPATWREVEQLIGTKRPKDYDRAVALLVDLRDLAERSGRTDEAARRTREIQKRHTNKPSLLRRLAEKKLGG
jgi:hypothetical protein